MLNFKMKIDELLNKIMSKRTQNKTTKNFVCLCQQENELKETRGSS